MLKVSLGISILALSQTIEERSFQAVRPFGSLLGSWEISFSSHSEVSSESKS